MILRRRRCETKSSTSQSEQLFFGNDDQANVIHRWRQPKALYLTVILCSIGAAVQGWDQTGSNGANLSFPVEFGIPDNDETDPNYERNLWLVGLVNAAPYIASAFLGCWLSDPLNNYFGRRGTIFFSAVFCLLSVIGSGFTQNWYQLFICRLLLGIGKDALVHRWDWSSTDRAKAWAAKPQRSLSTRQKTSPLSFVVAWSCHGKCVCTPHTDLLSPLTTSRDGIRHLPRILRQPRCLQRRPHRLASSTRLSIHSSGPSRHRHLLLSRISSLADEERSIPAGVQVAAPSPQLATPGCS